MSLPVHVLGLEADGPASLSPRARAALARATFVAGGQRHLALVEPPDGVETFVITSNLDALAGRLGGRGPDERCVVLASGDPLCFGIGRFLGERLDRGSLVVEPAVSSLQLAFARVVRSWNEARLASIHGRPLASTLIPLLGQPLIGLFTQDGTSPAAVAEFFLARGLDDYTAWVGEDMGTPRERVTRLDLADLPGRPFRDLNFLVLERSATACAARPVLPPDDSFAGPSQGPWLLTHRDVRVLALSRFPAQPQGPVWDVGSGLGGMAVGLANTFPSVEVVGVERSPRELEHLATNRRRFQAWNLRIVQGSAPEALAQETAPAAVFLGGSGGRLGAILDLVFDRLLPGGRLVANFVGLENLLGCLERTRGGGWAPEVTQVQVSQGQDLAGLTTFVPQRPVWVLSAARPG